MKFKSVEISAFRIYDNPVDATFDFSINNTQVADFVSLYAPNGFGKTSFYDAVEWGVTNNIFRFWQNRTTEQSLAALKDVYTEQIKLWRNRNSSRSRSTFVKITPESGTVLTRNLRAHGNSNSDISMPGVVENKAFRQVILSQEWISAFLKEMDGERRYELFMENPGLKDIEQYYRSAKELLSVCFDRTNYLQKQLGLEKEKLVELESGDVLNLVNQQIQFLNEKYKQSLNIVLLTTTQEEIFKMQSLISANRLANDQTSDIEKQINDIESAINGKSNQQLSIELFFEKKEQVISLNNEIGTIKSNLKLFENLESLNNQLISETEKKRLKNFTENRLKIIIEKFESYSTTLNDINIKRKDIDIINGDIKGSIIIKETLANNLIRERAELDSIVTQLNKAKEKLIQIPKTSEAILKLEFEIEKLNVTLNDENDRIQNYNLLIENCKNNIQNYNEIIKSIEINSFLILSKETALRFKDQIYNITNSLSTIEIISMDLDSLNNQIREHENLNSAVQDFIAEGLRIIQVSKTTSCPLCEHEYTSFETLSSVISNNKTLSEILQQLYQKRTLFMLQIKNSNDLLVQNRNQIKEFFYSKIEAEQKEQGTNEGELLNSKKLAAGFNEELLKVTQNRLSLVIFFDGKTVEEFSKKVDETIHEFENKAQEKEVNYNQVNIKLQEISTKIIECSSKIELLETGIQKLNSVPDYIMVDNWFRTNYPKSNASLILINNQLQNEVTEIQKISDSILNINREIEDLKNKLASFSQLSLSDQKTEKSKMLESLGMDIKGYESLLARIGINPILETRQLLKQRLTMLNNDKRQNLSYRNQLVVEYLKLEDFFKNLLPFLQTENAKIKIVSIQEDIEYLEFKVRPVLEVEKKSIRDFLEEKIKTFFYTNLINSIYNRIDPHPDFKSVLFKPDFDSDSPRLDVFVINGSNEETLIPNLYFSTAQINILSLSIFLATALNNSEYDCIFIDDPIQSMDSINILSTIDLLRSLIKRGDKQIILSTHDENFHKLLSKKIPAHYFKSKFMSLETFGKVKIDSQPTEENEVAFVK